MKSIMEGLENGPKDSKSRYLIAQLVTLDELRNHLDQPGGPGSPLRRLTWKGTKANLMELLIPLMNFVEVDGRPPTMKELVAFCEAYFNISLKNSSGIDNKNRNRKEPSAFLCQLQKIYVKRMNELEDGRG